MHSSWGRTELHIEGAEEGEGAGKGPVPREGSLALLLFILFQKLVLSSRRLRLININIFMC